MQKLKKDEANTNTQKNNKQPSRKTTNTNTGYPPVTTRPQINICQVPAGWDVFLFLFVFLKGVLLFVVRLCLLFVSVCFCLVFLSCCMYKRNNSSKHKQHKQTPLRKTTNNYSSSSRNLRDIYSRSIWYLFAVGSWAGYPVVLCVCVFVSKVCCCFYVFVVCVCVLCFRLVYLSCCIYNRQKTHIRT